jgi:hypothetical protein
MAEQDDLAFVRDVANWRSGPCLQIACFPHESERLSLLKGCFHADRFVSGQVPEVHWGDAVVWSAPDMPAIGLMASLYHENELHIWTYPPFVERATGHEWLNEGACSDPRMWSLHAALCGLVQRLAAIVPLRFAEIVEETQESRLNGLVTDGVVMYKLIASRSGLPIKRTVGEFAVVPW